jgi:phosphoserine phosphatase RsbU/P
MTSAAVLSQIDNQLLAACEVQQGFLQQRPPALDTLSYSARCRQVGEVGGDCYDFLPLSGDRLAFAIADASGKGVPAALMIANVQSSLRTAALFTGEDAAATVAVVNRQLCASSLDGKYATLFYGVFDAVTRTLHYVNAGHNPPVVIRRDSPAIWLDKGGVPVGLFPDCSYESGTVQLEPSDLVVCYTDGVVEAASSTGEEWGVKGLCRAALASRSRSAEDIVEAIFSAVNCFSPARQADDATVVVLHVG